MRACFCSLAAFMVSKYFPLLSFCHLPLIELVLLVDADVVLGLECWGELPVECLALSHATKILACVPSSFAQANTSPDAHNATSDLHHIDTGWIGSQIQFETIAL